jgi:hypothetical protein
MIEIQMFEFLVEVYKKGEEAVVMNEIIWAIGNSINSATSGQMSSLYKSGVVLVIIEYLKVATADKVKCVILEALIEMVKKLREDFSEEYFNMIENEQEFCTGNDRVVELYDKLIGKLEEKGYYIEDNDDNDEEQDKLIKPQMELL